LLASLLARADNSFVLNGSPDSLTETETFLAVDVGRIEMLALAMSRSAVPAVAELLFIFHSSAVCCKMNYVLKLAPKRGRIYGHAGQLPSSTSTNYTYFTKEKIRKEECTCEW